MTAFTSADILLPKLDAEGMTKWSVVACDQYTSEPEYWAKTAEIAGDAPSTLNLIFPEVYLEEPDADARIAKINRTMQEYLDKGLFNEYKSALILMRRTQADGKVRTGLVGAIDLEQYDYNKGSKSQVRATEATVASRIPPRVKIRRDAALELPHIMILIDDVKRTVIEPLEAKRDQLTKLYDFDLMQNGGHLEGWLVDGGHAKAVFDALDKLADKARDVRHGGGADNRRRYREPYRQAFQQRQRRGLHRRKDHQLPDIQLRGHMRGGRRGSAVPCRGHRRNKGEPREESAEVPAGGISADRGA